MTNNIVMAENICTKFGAKKILNDISFTINSKENWIVFGLNGSGKTTLLSVISGYYGISHGTLKVFSQELTKENRCSIRKRIGFISSSFFNRYFHNESVLDIVLSGKFGHLGIEKGISASDVKLVKELLGEWGLKKKYQYPYYSLSQGQQQKVLIVRALFSKPKLLVLDEPCSGMDIISREKFLRKLEELTINEDITLIYVSHNTEEFFDFFSHALLIKDGKIHSKGEIHKVFSSENISDFLEMKAKVVWLENRPSIRFLE